MAKLRHCFRRIDLQQYPAMAMAMARSFVPALDMAVTLSATNFRWQNDVDTSYPADHDF